MADAGNAASFTALPVPILHEIFFRLPVDRRLLLSAVSRGLRAALAATALWQGVDLSRGLGVRAPSGALLRDNRQGCGHNGEPARDRPFQ